MISLNEVKVVPTIFPDGTSQVWKLPSGLLEAIYKNNGATITWEFESEAELIHVAQLRTLLATYVPKVQLKLPYLPYARQDKRVDNDSTFALKTFAILLNTMGFDSVTVLDAHNPERAEAIHNLVNVSAEPFIQDALGWCCPQAVLFPDFGALMRYKKIPAKNNLYAVYATKDRNQSTGVITGIKLEGAIHGKRLLIIDDLCDGGGTFKLVAAKALEAGATEVHLYVTHGLFTKGIQTLRDSGIKRIFTYKGEIK